jgi:hypothetical protein
MGNWENARSEGQSGHPAWRVTGESTERNRSIKEQDVRLQRLPLNAGGQELSVALAEEALMHILSRHQRPPHHAEPLCHDDATFHALHDEH